MRLIKSLVDNATRAHDRACCDSGLIEYNYLVSKPYVVTDVDTRFRIQKRTSLPVPEAVVT